MITITFTSTSGSNLELVAAPDNGGNSQIPNLINEPGIYAINNDNTRSIYVGISDISIRNRFIERWASVFELGFFSTANV
ncbi:hypothetical protein B4N84_07645 [Flavobacterium sp. IR1]|nr:hypothetical protein B4N84_07645 [Flavobacterium sp. IR1]